MTAEELLAALREQLREEVIEELRTELGVSKPVRPKGNLDSELRRYRSFARRVPKVVKQLRSAIVALLVRTPDRTWSAREVLAVVSKLGLPVNVQMCVEALTFLAKNEFIALTKLPGRFTAASVSQVEAK